MVEQEQLAGQAARYRTNLRGEVDSAALYRALSDAEHDPRLREVYSRLAGVEEAHAEFWRKELDRVGAAAGRMRPGWRTHALAWLAQRFGPQFVLPTVTALERRDSGQYDSQPEAVAGGLPAAERSHERIVEAVAGALPARRLPAPRWRNTRAATAAAATHCERRCSAPMTGSSPISAW